MHISIARRGNSSSGNADLIVGVVCASVVIISILVFLYLRSLRGSHSNPKYVPTSFLKNRWRSWTPSSRRSNQMLQKNTALSSLNTEAGNTSYNPSFTTNGPTTRSLDEISTGIATNGVDRNTSIRSIMTLPPYRPSPAPSERLIAREGERAGVDTVIEFPETADEEELRREQDMEALYQVRQARRIEQQARIERRRQRQQAREAGDWTRLEDLRLDSQMRAHVRTQGSGTTSAAAVSTTSLGLAGPGSLAADAIAGRDRRVSSVSYASLGLARHDGSRLRADSVESNDQRPLLDSAASMGGSASGSRRGSSLFQPPRFQLHQRTASVESVISMDSDNAMDTPYTSTSHGERSNSDPPGFVTLTPSASQETGSNGDSPLGEPPRYEDSRHADQEEEEAPPYMSPVSERGATSIPRLPSIRGLPAIEVTSTTPGNSVPATPVDGEEGRRGL